MIKDIYNLDCGTCYNIRTLRACSSTDRASVFGTEGWGFESLQARQ